jgi:hypothetical protein
MNIQKSKIKNQKSNLEFINRDNQMKRSNDHEQFMRWQEYLSSKKGKEELSSAERKQEFQAFMEFESMKNEYYQEQDSNSSDSPNPSNDLSSSQSSSASRTNSVQSSDSNCSSSIQSNDPHYISNDHRHFKIPSLSLTPLQFENRLKDRLPNDVIQSNLFTRFKPLSIFREKYILPLSKAYPGQEIELTTISNFEYQSFLSDYVILFVEGCQVKRKVRSPGKKQDQVVKDTKQREMFRDFFKDLWGILGTY